MNERSPFSPLRGKRAWSLGPTRRDEASAERQRRLHPGIGHDPLTRLPNRALLMDRLGQALHGTARSGGRVAVLYVGLDGLQPILHAHGRDAGNLLLKEAAQRLAAETRASDTLARCGGEAFLLFLQNIKTAENALLVARKHLAALGSDFALGDGHVQVSASIGIALFPEHGSSPEILVKGAEAAMARGREQGRNRIEVFTDSLHEAVSERLQLGNGLHRALDQGEFQLYYQPRIHLQRRSWAGAEALIRWNHPGLGLVMPDRFIPLAEQTGLILPLGEWVIQEACRQMRLWQEAGIRLPRVAVNVSPLQLQSQDLPGIVRRALAENGLCSRALELEIVESALMADVKRTAEVLKALRDLGVKVSIDDFGTGYSSLGHLRNLPVDILKVDRVFLQRIHESRKDQQILEAILNMAASLRLEVVAEGIESPEQEAILLDLGCQEGQGYLYARPMPAGQCAFALRSGFPLDSSPGPGLVGPGETCCHLEEGAAQPPPCCKRVPDRPFADQGPGPSSLEEGTWSYQPRR